jgi:hypothetical protein
MAAGTIQYIKYPSGGSGEAQHVVKIGIIGGTAPTDQSAIFEVRVNKDVYDQLHADQKTALDAITVANILAASYN